MARDDIRKPDDPRLVGAMKRAGAYLDVRIEFETHNAAGFGVLTMTPNWPGSEFFNSANLAGSHGHGISPEQAFHVCDAIENLFINQLVRGPYPAK